MKVRELIEQLKFHDPEMDVMIINPAIPPYLLLHEIKKVIKISSKPSNGDYVRPILDIGSDSYIDILYDIVGLDFSESARKDIIDMDTQETKLLTERK